MAYTNFFYLFAEIFKAYKNEEILKKLILLPKKLQTFYNKQSYQQVDDKNYK